MNRASLIRPFGVSDFWLLVFGIPLLALTISSIFFANSLGEGWLCYRQNFFPATLSTSIFWFGNRQIVILLRRRYRDPQENAVRLVFTILLVLLFTVSTAHIMNLMDAGSVRTEPNPFLDSSPGKKVGATVFATLTVLAIYEALFYFRQWKDSLQAAERLKKEHTISQLEALRSQVNPHFLFNSLNTLASLIPEDPSRAVVFVHELSKVYRNILDLKEREAVTLAEELECLHSYLYLVGERFGESLHVDVRVDEAAQRHYIVPLSLQILAENAIKHNIVSRKKPLRLEILSHDGFLMVGNNLQLKAGKQEGTGTGLRNIKERFRLTFGKDVRVEETATHFSVYLPLISIES